VHTKEKKLSTIWTVVDIQSLKTAMILAALKIMSILAYYLLMLWEDLGKSNVRMLGS
jgi:hypothetical protein